MTTHYRHITVAMKIVSIAWFARQLNDLAHRVKNIIFANVPMETLPKQQWEAYQRVVKSVRNRSRRTIRESAIISPVDTAVRRIQIVT